MTDRADTTGARAMPTLAPPPDAKSGVTLEAGAGKGEAELLMVGALRAAAATIVDATLAACAAAASPEILMFVGSETVDLSPLDRFDAACAQLAARLDAALAAAALAPAVASDRGLGDRGVGDRGVGDRGLAEVIATAVPGLGIATTALSLAATAAQYFAVRTRFAGIELTVQDGLLRRELAAALLARRAGVSVRLVPLHDRAASAAIVARLQELGDRGAAATAAADRLAGSSAPTERVAELRAAASAEAEFRARLTAADTPGGAALSELAELRAIHDALDRNAALLFATTAHASGGQFSRQGLFGGILRDPTSEVCAAVVVGYTVLSGPSLALVATGNVRAPARYVALRDVAASTDDTVVGRRP